MDHVQLLAKFRTFPPPRVLVVGDLMIDRYVTGDVERISPEAPIAVLAARHSEDRLGGAGNVVANLRAMDVAVTLVGVIGDDGRGRQLREMFEALGVEAGGCIVDGERPTTEKTRLLSGMHQLLRVDWEIARPVSEAVSNTLADAVRERVATSDAVVLSDYGKGALTQTVITAAITAARQAGVPLLVDPKGDDYTRYRGATLITPNRKEAEEALGRKLAALEDIPGAARELLDQAELSAVVITLGADGMFHLTRDGSSARVPTFARAVFDVTGAGDTVIAHLACALGGGFSLEEAVHLANTAAGIVVGRRGAAVVRRSELAAELEETSPTGGKVLDYAVLDEVLAGWRAQKKRIVFTNGCFDIVHKGHVSYLRHARSKGDVLIVGINSDASVRRLKGPTRPINPVEDRADVLAALESVDAVIPFEEDTPQQIIERVTPDVLVKGEDWADKGVVGREWVEAHGGEVYLAPLEPGRSTTSILERARGSGSMESGPTGPGGESGQGAAL